MNTNLLKIVMTGVEPSCCDSLSSHCVLAVVPEWMIGVRSTFTNVIKTFNPMYYDLLKVYCTESYQNVLAFNLIASIFGTTSSTNGESGSSWLPSRLFWIVETISGEEDLLFPFAFLSPLSFFLSSSWSGLESAVLLLLKNPRPGNFLCLARPLRRSKSLSATTVEDEDLFFFFSFFSDLLTGKAERD